MRDLHEIFASALEHGETEQQVIERLGKPKEFADSTAEQFGIDPRGIEKTEGSHCRRCRIYYPDGCMRNLCCWRSWESAERGNRPGDATTNVQVEGTFGFDALQIILAVGLAAALLAVLLLIRTIHKNRGQR